MAMKRQSDGEACRTWYLWAKNDDPVTNEYLAKVVGEQNTEFERRDVLCADGRRRNLWQCPNGFDTVRTATAAVSAHPLKLGVFWERGDGVIKAYMLWKKLFRKKALAKRRLHGLHTGRELLTH